MVPRIEVAASSRCGSQIPVFPCPGAGVRCHFAVLDTYISKLPPVAFQKDWFYMKPLRHDVVSEPSKPWYAAQPCGENKLAGMVKSMFAMIGVSGKTNHSLRATGASMMFQAGVPEKIVQERTGHRSLEALRMYERTTTTQHMEVSRVLSAQKDQQDEAKSTCNSSLPGDTAGGVFFYNLWHYHKLCHQCQFLRYRPSPVSTWYNLVLASSSRAWCRFLSVFSCRRFSRMSLSRSSTGSGSFGTS